MPDRETITIPAPVARPGEAIEVRDGGYWKRATLFSARYTEQVGGLVQWEYDVVYVADRKVTAVPYHVATRRVESGA